MMLGIAERFTVKLKQLSNDDHNQYNYETVSLIHYTLPEPKSHIYEGLSWRCSFFSV